MKKIQSVSLWVITATLLAMFSCNDPTVIGSDLLIGDELDIDFTDTVTVRSYVTKGDSIRTYSPIVVGLDFQSFLCGDFLDPVFGRSKSSIYAQLSLNTTLPSFTDATVDSIVLILPWQSAHVYGNLKEEYKIEVYELDQTLDPNKTYYSTNGFATKPNKIGETIILPKPSDSINIVKPAKDTTIFEKLPPQLRINMGAQFTADFFTANAGNFASDTSFSAFFKGIHIRAASQNGGMLSFNLRNSAAGLKVYYQKDNAFLSYTFPITATDVVSTQFSHDYMGAIVENYISAGQADDDLVFLQGMAGVNFVVELPYVENLKNLIVNRAELEFTILRLPEDNQDYAPVIQMIASEIKADSTAGIINDAQFAINRAGSNFYQLFGGDVDADGKYRVNISSHFQDMIRGKKGKKIRIEVLNRAERAGRVVLGGAGHAVSPIKLNLSYTRY